MKIIKCGNREIFRDIDKLEGYNYCGKQGRERLDGKKMKKQMERSSTKSS